MPPVGPNAVKFTLSVDGAEYCVAFGPVTNTAIISGPLQPGRKPPILHMIGHLDSVHDAREACEKWIRDMKAEKAAKEKADTGETPSEASGETSGETSGGGTPGDTPPAAPATPEG